VCMLFVGSRAVFGSGEGKVVFSEIDSSLVDQLSHEEKLLDKLKGTFSLSLAE